MPHPSLIAHRRRIRLKGYDYSQAGMYFVTMCVQNRQCLFGEIVGAGFARPNNVGAGSARPNIVGAGSARLEMVLNDAGKIIETQWLNLKNKYSNIDLYEYIVMPNHFHAILKITHPIVGAGSARPNNDNAIPIVRAGFARPNNDNAIPIGAGGPRPYVPTLGNMIAYFKYQTTKQIDLPTKLWQRNYYEHIIRNDNSYQRIADYIINNPAKWDNDKFYTA